MGVNRVDFFEFFEQWQSCGFFFLMKNVNKHMTIKVCIKVDLI